MIIHNHNMTIAYGLQAQTIGKCQSNIKYV